MKKVCILIIITVLITGCGETAKNCGETMPYKDLSDSDIVSATLELLPPDLKVELNADGIKKLTDILRTVEIYEEDDSYRDYVGQAVIYTITMADGSVEKIMAYNPFIVINDVGYKTKYESCEELNSLGNTIGETAFGK